MGKYIVQTPLMLGAGKKAKRIEVDSVVELDDTDKEVQALVACGAIRIGDETLQATAAPEA